MTSPPGLLQRSLVEFAGTAVLAYSIARASHSDLDSFQQAWLIGLTLCLLIHICGRFSGAHFNPAVTLLLQLHRCGWAGLARSGGALEILAYGSAQIAGATLAFALDPWKPSSGGFSPEALIPELIFSLLLFGVIQVWSHEGRLCPFAQPLTGVVVGSALVALVLLGGLTKSGLYNPAIALAIIWTRGLDGVWPLIAAELLAIPLLLALNPRLVKDRVDS